MDHAGLRELIAGGVLGGLDRSERATVDGHLPACADCQGLEGQLSGVVTELALCVQPRTAPAALRGRILGTLPGADGAAAEWLVPRVVLHRGQGAATHRARPRLGWAPAVSWARAALSFVLAAALLAVGTGWLTLRTELDQTRGLLTAATAEQGTQAAAMQLVADPAHLSAWLEPSGPGFESSVLVVYLPGSEQAYLVASGLPFTPQGRVYQFWHADEAGVHPGRTFAVNDADVVLIPISRDLSRAQAVMLTLETEGGSRGEPGADVVFGELPPS